MRRAGVLLHPTSLAGPSGMGDIGPASRTFIEWLDAAGQRVWQMLPLNPVDGGGCPYASPSAFAREPLLLSPDDLVVEGWLRAQEKPPEGSRGCVDWPAVEAARRPALMLAADRVRRSVDLKGWAAERPWLSAWSLYRALVQTHGPRWSGWPDPLRHVDADALAAARDQHAAAVESEVALQWLFEQQWRRLREVASVRGISLWGDLPIFVGLDSCDVWSDRSLFRLDEDDQPLVVTGAPPDAFCPQGQRWGHPMYDVAAHRRTAHRWWRCRTRSVLDLVDTVRIDHFRGIESSWEIPAGDDDAVGGRWVAGLGVPLLEAIVAEASDRECPFVAEDLGVITPAVTALRDRFGLPGMAVLQFAFDGAADVADWNHRYLPHQHRPHQVVYTGTHDNDTVLGWFRGGSPRLQDRVRRYLSCGDDRLPWALVQAAWRSPCDTAIVPMQDLLCEGSESRMNTPGTIEGNWSWRMGPDALRADLAAWVAEQGRCQNRFCLNVNQAAFLVSSSLKGLLLQRGETSRMLGQHLVIV